MSAIRAANGGQAVAAVLGTNVTNEAAYLAQKLMRTVVGSNNVDSIDHTDLAAAEKALTAVLGTDAVTNSRVDLEEAGAILVLGANLSDSDPVLALTIVQALRQNKPVIVVDPRSTELAGKAKYHVALKPGADLAVLRALMKHILDLKLQDAAFIDANTEGFAALEASLAGVDVAAEAAVAGVDAELLKAAAVDFAQAGAAAIFVGPGLTQGAQAVEAIGAAADLALLTGNVGRPGAGLYPVRAGANSQGLQDMGVRPDGLSADDRQARGRVGREPGGAAGGCRSGRSGPGYRGRYDQGSVRHRSRSGPGPRRRRTRQGLLWPSSNASWCRTPSRPTLLTQPASCWPPLSPSRTKAPSPTASASSNACALRLPPPAPACRTGPSSRGSPTLSARTGSTPVPADVMREISELYPATAVSPTPRSMKPSCRCPAARTTATALRSCWRTARKKFAFAAVPAATAGRRRADFTLLTGSVKEHHATGVRTRRSAGSTKLVPEARLEINPADAARLGVADGDMVRAAAAAGGAVEVEAAVTDRVPAGCVFLPGFSAAAPVARLLKSGGHPKVAVTKI